MSTSTPVRICFDFISPYAYSCWFGVHDVAARHGRSIEPVPVLFAGLLNAHGQKGPAEIPAKRVYTFKDAFRKAHALGLGPISPPPSHPFNPLCALRVASLDLPAADRRRVIDTLYRAVWAGGGGIETPEKVSALLDGIGLDGSDLVRRASSPEIKDRLRRATDDAIAENVFGVPTMIADGELFWGVDSLALLDQFLRGEDPVPRDVAERWGGLRASASRI